MRKNAWHPPFPSMPVDAPPFEPVSLSPSPPPLKFDENNQKSFAETLYQIWWRLPDITQERIISLIAGTDDIVPEYTDAYTALKKICTERTITASTLNQIKALIFTSQMITFNQRRFKMLDYYAKHQACLTLEQKEILCGIVINMVPVTFKESFSAPVDRVIAAAITNGADFDAFQFFIDFLNATVQINKNKSK